MKKREISKLSLNKNQISSFNVYHVKGGLVGAETQCEETCDCNVTKVQSCGTEKSKCIICHSEK